MEKEKGMHDTQDFSEGFYEKGLGELVEKINAAESFEELLDEKVLNPFIFSETVEKINEARSALKNIKMNHEKISELLDAEDLFSHLSLDPKINKALKSKLVSLLKKEL